jgi:hypothetical protein
MFSHGIKRPNLERLRGQKMNHLRKEEIEGDVFPALREAANNNAKHLAILGGVGPETAKNWIEGRNLPALSTFINMARECRELRALAIKLMDPDGEFDPDFMRTCMEMAQHARKKFDRPIS